MLNNLDKQQNERLKQQKGLFTKSKDGRDIKKEVESFSKKNDYAKEEKVLLAVILIPDSAQNQCLEYLKSRSEKITQGALFPD